MSTATAPIPSDPEFDRQMVERVRKIFDAYAEEWREKNPAVLCADGRYRYPLSAFAKLKELGEAETAKKQQGTTRNYQGDRGELGRVAAAILNDLYDPSDPKDVARECLQIAALAAKPGAFSEPIHHATVGVFKHCGLPGELHYLALLDPAWRDKGQAKLDNWTAGPTKCTHFEDVNKDGCKGCPHKGKITSPIQLGQMTARRRDYDYLRSWYRE